jgi:hypothetical protein
MIQPHQPASEPTLQAKPHIISVDHGDRTVLLDAETEQYFSLNITGREVWALLCDGTTRDDITRHLSEKYGSDSSRVSHDVDDMLGRLIRLGLVAER